MRGRGRAMVSSAASVTQIDPRYAPRRAEVDAAYRRMRELGSVPHSPAEARRAATELETVLREATATAGQALRSDPPQPPLRSVRARRRRGVSLAVPATVIAWTAELVRLSEIGVWLRRSTLDELGVHVPYTVRVGSRAATGPHIPGLVFEPDDLVAATIHQPRIGAPLQEIIDGVGRRAAALPSAASPAAPSRAA